MGMIRLTSALIVPAQSAPARIPPIPSWQILGIPLRIPHRWVGLWGYHNTTVALGEARAVAAAEGMRCHTAIVSVPIKKSWTGSLSLAGLSRIDYLPLDQVGQDLHVFLLEILAGKHQTRLGVPQKAGRRTRRRKTEERIGALLTRRPEMANLLFRHPAIAHVRVITWQSSYGIGLGVVRDPGCVSTVDVWGLPGPYRLAGWSRIWGEGAEGLSVSGRRRSTPSTTTFVKRTANRASVF